jgi:hypothetical protein
MRFLPRSHMGVGVGAFFASFFFGNFLNPFAVMPLAQQLGSRADAVEVWGFILLGISLLAAITSFVVGRDAARNPRRNSPHDPQSA